MRNSKKLLALGLTAAMASSILLMGCSGNTNSKDTKTEDTKVEDTKDDSSAEVELIEIVAKGLQHQFWQAVKQGTEQAGKDFNVEINFQGPEGESATAEQINMLKAAIGKKPAAIAFAALDVNAAMEALEEAKNDNIPIIGFDSGVPGAPEGSIKANASTDNIAAGAMAAEEMYKVIKDKVTDPENLVRIGIVSQDATSESISGRTQGFIDKMASLIGEDKVSIEGHDKYNKKVDDAKIVLQVAIPAEVKDDAGVAQAQSLLNEEDLIAIYGSNEFGANCIITANETYDKLGADKVIAVGFDAGVKQKNAIKEGVLIGSITQDPVQIGYKAVELAVKVAKGESVSDVDTGAKWYDASNIDTKEMQPLLYD